MPLSLSAVKRNHFKTKIIILNVATLQSFACVSCRATHIPIRTDDDKETRYGVIYAVYCSHLKFSSTIWTPILDGVKDERLRWATAIQYQGQERVVVTVLNVPRAQIFWY